MKDKSNQPRNYSQRPNSSRSDVHRSRLSGSPNRPERYTAEPRRQQGHRAQPHGLRPPEELRSRQYGSHPQSLQPSQQYTSRRAPAARKGSRLLLYLCMLLAIVFVVLIFVWRDQIIAPTQVQTENTTEDSIENVTGEIGAINNFSTDSSLIESDPNAAGGVSAETLPSEPEIVVDSPKTQLTETSLEEVNSEPYQEQPRLSTNEQTNTSTDSTEPLVFTNNGLQPGTRFRVDQSVGNPKVDNILFRVRSAEVQPERLVLTTAFENAATNTTRFSHIDPVPLEQIRLTDANGGLYQALAADLTLLAIQPDNGFAPKGANIGSITFALPDGPGPFTLSGIHDYPAILITAEMYLNATVRLPSEDMSAVPPFVPDGNYEVYTQVTSSLEELEPLVLHVRTIDLTADSLNLHIGFSNNTLQKFGLLSGPSGSNAWLLDKSQRQYAPRIVSESLRELITPAQGILPGEEHQGVLTFPRPSDLTEIRFVLESYNSITVRFGPTGINEVQQDAFTDTGSAPIPIISSGVQAYREISNLLNNAADSVAANDQATYVASFSEPMQALQQYVFNRLIRLPPLTNFHIELLLPSQLEGVNIHTGNPISTPELDVQVRYNLKDIAIDNPFIYDFSARFVRSDGRWEIIEFAPKRNHPFWWGSDFSLYETEHFLIFTRPDSVQNLQTLQSEVEIAYAELAARGIKLEQKYVAYFTGPQDSLYALTGMANTHLVGVALSRYDINGRDANTGERTINAINRAFYVNSEQFVTNQNLANLNQSSILRQSIITHELVHLAFSHSARPFTPPWLSEGIAVYYSEQFIMDTAYQFAQEGKLAQITLAELTGLETLGDHDIIGQQTELRYIYSGAVVRYLIEKYGEQQVQSFFRAYAAIPADYIENRMPSKQDSQTSRSAFRQMSIDLTDTYIVEYFGMTLFQLDQRVKEWLGAQ